MMDNNIFLRTYPAVPLSRFRLDYHLPCCYLNFLRNYFAVPSCFSNAAYTTEPLFFFALTLLGPYFRGIVTTPDLRFKWQVGNQRLRRGGGLIEMVFAFQAASSLA